MATIVTRAGKGSPLTHTEVDANFTNLNDEAATKAPLASPALTGTPTAPTATVGTNTTQIATTAFVIANAGSLNSPAFTGTPTAPTASVGTNTTQLATTAFVNAEIANDAPTKTGGGASGTWSIAISGNAETASTASNTTSISSAVGSGYTWTGLQYFQSNANTGSSFGVPLQAYSSSGGAIMAFHRAGVYAVNMGLDSDNVFRIGGWSAGANRLQLDMSGNLTLAGAVSATSFSSAGVGAGTAGIGAGNVGSYAYCTRAGNSSTYTIGSTIGGGDLRYSNANGLNSGTPGGTWRCMGYAAGTPNSVNTTTLWLRIS